MATVARRSSHSDWPSSVQDGPHHGSFGRKSSTTTPNASTVVINFLRIPCFYSSSSVSLSELGPEEEDLRGVVDPQQNQNQRSGRAKSRAYACTSQVESQGPFTNREEQSGHYCTGPDVFPLHFGVW